MHSYSGITDIGELDLQQTRHLRTVFLLALRLHRISRHRGQRIDA